MQKITLCLSCALLALGLQSCFKSEPLNAECDIEEAYVSVADPKAYFFNPSDTLVRVPSDRNSIIFDVRQSANLSEMAPRFVLTPGATIVPASGSVHDFSKGPVDYTVTSQDGKYKRTYSVTFRPNIRSTSEIQLYNFDHYYLDYANKKYYCWTDLSEQGDTLFNWATANPGYMLAKGTAKPDEYPTVPCEGINGMGVLLETRSTGAFGAMVGRRLAAGNLFIGTFDMGKALTETLKATRFGLPLAMKPIKLSGYYKYIPGPTYTDASGATLDRQDSGTIYAIFYRNHDKDGNPIVLYGDDAQTSPNLVALARMDIRRPHESWEKFEITFDYMAEVDIEELDANGYSFAIVASSSLDGDIYSGAVGSQLYIDEFELQCQKIEE